MNHETINRKALIEQFHGFLQVGSSYRMWQIIGEGKTGKSHLVTKVFPALACHECNTVCAVIDMRSAMQSALDILQNIVSLLSGEATFPCYYTAYKEWLSRPQIEVSSLRAIFSMIKVRAKNENDELDKVLRHLTSQLIIDLRAISSNILILFDSMERAELSVQNWLMYTLLVQLISIPHVKVVVAGRSMPKVASNCIALCQNFELREVKNLEDYVSYCRQIDAQISEESIRDFAFALDYKPGLFVELVKPKFVNRENIHG